MIIKSLTSSSKANCHYISDGETSILLDCGLPIKKSRKVLNFKISDLSGVIATHEHRDHCRATKDFMKAGIDCYCLKETAGSLGLSGHRLNIIEPLKDFRIGSMTIKPFSTVHDVENIGLLVVSDNGEKLLYLTDTPYCNYQFKGLNYILIESNYQAELLERNIESGAVSIAQKNRLLFSHMSLGTLLGFLEKMDRSKLKSIHLMHLSNGNSNESEMKRQVMELTGLPVTICMER